MRKFKRLRLIGDWLVGLTTAVILAVPGIASARELSIEEILAALYGAENVERVPDRLDQVWLNEDGSATAKAKFTANPNGKFGFMGDDDVVNTLFRFTGSNNGFDVAGSGQLPDSTNLREFRWVLTDLAIGGGTWSTRPGDNSDGSDHAITYRITGGASAGNFVLFWEDLTDVSGSDFDFNDFVVEVSGVALSSSPPPTYAFTLKPSALAFGNQALSTNTTDSFWLHNTNSNGLPIASVALVGPDSSMFSVENRCGFLVEPGASCRLRVTFRPTSEGPRVAKLRVVAGDSQVRTRDLTGTAVESSLVVAPTSLSFGSVPIDKTSVAKVVRVSNPTASPLPISSIRLGGTNPYQFAIKHDCQANLAAGSSCSISVALRPTSLGTASATLTITPGGGAARSVLLSGAGN